MKTIGLILEKGKKKKLEIDDKKNGSKQEKPEIGDENVKVQE